MRATIPAIAALALVAAGSAMAAAPAAAGIVPGGPPPVATTAYVTADNTYVVFVDGTGISQSLTITQSAVRTIVLDAATTVTPGKACAVVGSDHTKVTCTVPGSAPFGVKALLGDGNDYAYVDTRQNQDAAADVLYGGPGNDTLVLANSDGACGYQAYGEDGDDHLYNELNVSDCGQLYGGNGNDTLWTEYANEYFDAIMDGGPGADQFYGPGVADYSSATGPVTVSIDDVANDGQPGEGDNVHTGVTTVFGSPYADTITGSANNDQLLGGAGDDTLYGLDGDDFLQGWGGADTMYGGNGNDGCYGGSDFDNDNPGDTAIGCEYLPG